MKIIFLLNEQNKKNPDRVYGCSYTLYPTPDLATLYNAAVLKKAGHEVLLHRVKNIKDKLPRADIYLINSVILSYKDDLIVARKVSKKLVFFFGPYPTLYPEKYLKNQNHFILRGETEHYISDAILNPKKSLGVSYKTKTGYRHNKTAGIITDLDSVPFPARELDEAVYYNPKLHLKKFTNVLSSRGCANRCYFCVPNSISWAREIEWKKTHPNKPPVVVRSAQNVIDELEEIKTQGYEEFSFIDDQFVVVKDRVLEIARNIKRLKFQFGLLARADRLHDKTIIKALAEAGCEYIDLGVESFNQEILDDIRKEIEVKTIMETIKWLAEYKIDPKLNIMLGTSPKENEIIIEDTIRKALTSPANYCMFSIATPFPGTEFRKVAQKNKWIIKDDDTNPASVAQISYPHLTNRTLEKLVRQANARFYLRWPIILNMIKKSLTWKTFRENTKLFFNWLNNFR
jgi:radical SAM superfamily enzyme YgiQ (UPF0313 family)